MRQPQEDGVAGARFAACAPGSGVVDVAERAGNLTGQCLAGLLLDDQRDPLGLGVEPVRPAEVEDMPALVEHRGDELALTGPADQRPG